MDRHIQDIKHIKNQRFNNFEIKIVVRNNKIIQNEFSCHADITQI